MPKTLHKVQKQVAKKRGGKTNSLNPNSRDALRLQQAVRRGEKLKRQMRERIRSDNPHVERVRFFQEITKDGVPFTRPEELCRLALFCIDRNDKELKHLRDSRRPGRPASAREEKLSSIQESETMELKSGYWMPDLRDEPNIRKLQQWDGQWSSLGTIKFIRTARVDDEDTITESSFPPKGLS